jgi:pimeloyl-ACP methyl ester carboxylesterase
MGHTFATIDWAGRPVSLELAWLNEAHGAASEAASPAAPLMVFLHEGLGSVAMWREFPQELCKALGMRGLVYSRPGYGRSTPRAPGEKWAPDFMHRQADEVLPALLKRLRIEAQRQPLWLFGHSDGASIALLYAAHHPHDVAGAVLLAPHIMVEDICVRSIAKACDAYRSSGLRERLAKYHDDVDSAFHGWNDIWLDPRFRAWSIEAELGSIRCPLLAVQGKDDEYGTLEQVRGIARRVPRTRVLELDACGHSPHRDQPEAVIAAVQNLVFRTHNPPKETST